MDVPDALQLMSDNEWQEIRAKLGGKFDKMMKALFRQKGAQIDIGILASDEAQDFINTHAGILDSSFEKVEMSDLMRERLTRSDYIFSGMKAFHEMNEAFPSLLDENGARKPFEKFLNDVRKLDETYNAHYLHAEYNFVHASAQMAAKWEEFEEDGDRYYLQYRTQHDDKVRPEHAALDRVTLPMSDPFWESYYPPNGWNCFTPGTPVLTANGWKNIVSIKKGDLVVGGSGELRKVTATLARPFKGDLVTVISKGAKATCTPNHRFCTRRGWVKAEDLHKGDIIIQAGEHTTLHLLVHAVGNAYTLLRYGLMACIRKGKAIASLAVYNKAKAGDKEINHVLSHKLALLERNAQFVENAMHGSAIDSPMGGEPSEASLFGGVPEFSGIKDIHAFDGFHSFFDFLRKTFLHNRYVLVEGKITKKKRETMVFNLSISKDESYIVPIGIVHNCRCTVAQVLKWKYEKTDPQEAMNRGREALDGEKYNIFKFNSGKQGKAMPDYNPYTIKRCNDCSVAKGDGIKLAFTPDNEVCSSCLLLQHYANDRTKSNSTIERTHYVQKEMKHLLHTNVEKSIGSKNVTIKFDMKCNKHLFSDVKSRTRRLRLEDLKNIHRILQDASYIGSSPPKQGHSNGFSHFYYFKAHLSNGQYIRINVGKKVRSQKNGRVKTEYYCYSINNI